MEHKPLMGPHGVDPAAFATADMLVLDDLTTATTVVSRPPPLVQSVHSSPSVLDRSRSRSLSLDHPNFGPFGHPARPGSRGPKGTPAPKGPPTIANGQGGGNGIQHPLPLAHLPVQPTPPATHMLQHFSTHHPAPGVDHSSTYHPTPGVANGPFQSIGNATLHGSPPGRSDDMWKRLNDRVAHIEAAHMAENAELLSRVATLEMTIQSMKDDHKAGLGKLKRDMQEKIDELRYTRRNNGERPAVPAEAPSSRSKSPTGRNGIISPYYKAPAGQIDEDAPIVVKNPYYKALAGQIDEDALIVIKTQIQRTPSSASNAVSTGIPASKKDKSGKGKFSRTPSGAQNCDSPSNFDSDQEESYHSNGRKEPRSTSKILQHRVGVPGMAYLLRAHVTATCWPADILPYL